MKAVGLGAAALQPLSIDMGIEYHVKEEKTTGTSIL
jgi:hypothetical protein